MPEDSKIRVEESPRNDIEPSTLKQRKRTSPHRMPLVKSVIRASRYCAQRVYLNTSMQVPLVNPDQLDLGFSV